MEMQASGQDVLVVRALDGLQEACVCPARDALSLVEVASIDLDLGQHGQQARDAGPVPACTGVLDQSLDSAATFGWVAVVAEDPPELQVGMLEDRHGIERDREGVCALHEVPPRPAERAQPRGGVAQRLTLQGAIAELPGQAQRQEHVETSAAPAPPRQIADSRKAGMDRNSEPRILDRHRHGPAEQDIRGIEVREHQGNDRPPGEHMTQGRTWR